jgi:hypothetical protein
MISVGSSSKLYGMACDIRRFHIWGMSSSIAHLMDQTMSVNYLPGGTLKQACVLIILRISCIRASVLLGVTMREV